MDKKLECEFQQCPPRAVSYGLQLARGPQTLAPHPAKSPEPQGVWSGLLRAARRYPRSGLQAPCVHSPPRARACCRLRACWGRGCAWPLEASAARGGPGWACARLAQCVRACVRACVCVCVCVCWGWGDPGRGKAHCRRRPLIPTSPERGNGSLHAKPVPITPCSQHFWAVHASFENLPESSRG